MLTILAILQKSRVRVSGTIVKRLTIWLTAVTVLYELILALNLRYYFDPSDVAFCVADGFLIQYVGSVQFLFTLGISLTVFFKVWEVAAPCKPAIIDTFRKKRTSSSCDVTINVLEVVFLIVVLIFPPLFDWIPFTTNSYGPTGPWCWIRTIEKNCTMHTAGLAEQIVFWNIPFGFVALLTLLPFIAALCLLHYANKHGNHPKMMITDSILSLAFLAIMFVLFVLEATTRSYSFNHHNVDV